MKLVLVDSNGDEFDVTEDIDEYDLDKGLARASVAEDIKSAVQSAKEAAKRKESAK